MSFYAIVRSQDKGEGGVRYIAFKGSGGGGVDSSKTPFLMENFFDKNDKMIKF
jgi:hypothetical protein